MEQESPRPRYPQFPPAPDDTLGWERYLQLYPGLEPTYCKELNAQVRAESPPSQPPVRGGVTRPVARMVRSDIRLRALGNGVVPTTCARALRVLSAQLMKENENFPELPWKERWDE